jgi:ribosome-associated protein
VHLRFDFLHSPSLPDFYKQRLLKSSDTRINKDGIIVIKAQKYRSQDMNKEDACQRLAEIIQAAGVTKKKRRPTRPTKSSQLNRLETKTKQARNKQLRKSVRLNND